MKHRISYALLAAAALTISCEKIVPESGAAQEELGKATLNVRIELPQAEQTKAVSSYVTAQTYESAVNNAQILVFDTSGALNAYKKTTGTSESLSVAKGSKLVYAVINGPDLSDVKTRTELENKSVDLTANSKTASRGFLMVGSNTCQMSSDNTACTVTVERLACRVALVSIRNGLPSSYGKVSVERVWLSNVVGNQTLDGTAAPSTWYNKEGRADESTRAQDHIINGSQYKASCEELTYSAINTDIDNGAAHTPSTPYLMYGYANGATTAPDGFKASFAAQRTVLVIAASISGKRYYYPVVLNKSELVKNTCYTVDVSITGFGSEDPNKPVSKGSVASTITVKDWTGGSTYEEVI